MHVAGLPSDHPGVNCSRGFNATGLYDTTGVVARGARGTVEAHKTTRWWNAFPQWRRKNKPAGNLGEFLRIFNEGHDDARLTKVWAPTKSPTAYPSPHPRDDTGNGGGHIGGGHIGGD